MRSWSRLRASREGAIGVEINQDWKDKPKIVVVDDVEMNTELLAAILESMGCEPYCALNVQEALDIMKNVKPQLVMSDYTMPGMDGIEFCRLLKSKPQTRDIPFVLVTVSDAIADKKAAYEAGAADFISKPYDRIEVIMRVNNHLNNYRNKQELEDYNHRMHKLVAEHQREAEMERENLLLALCKIVERGEKGDGNHGVRVGYNAHLLAQSMQLVPEYEHLISDEFIDMIEISARLHDIGNVVLSEELRYQDRQTGGKSETAIQMHTEEGANLLREIDNEKRPSRFLNMAIDIARCHHANWDGSGYPKGLGGDKIPLAARIVAVVNDFERLTCESGGVSVEECVELLGRQGGVKYDPGIVAIFDKVWKKMKTYGEAELSC